MISKTIVAALAVAGLVGSVATAAPNKRTDQRAATRALNNQQLAAANSMNTSPTMAPGMAAPATDPSMAAPVGQVAPPAGESTSPPADSAAPAMMTPTEAAPSTVPPQ